MNKKTQTSNTTSTSKRGDYGWHGVNCTENADGVTLTITGAAFKNLRKICEIFNEWDGANCTPASMLWRECFSQSSILMTLGDDSSGDETLPAALVDIYQAAPDVAKLAAAFKAAGLVV